MQSFASIKCMRTQLICLHVMKYISFYSALTVI